MSERSHFGGSEKEKEKRKKRKEKKRVANTERSVIEYIHFALRGVKKKKVQTQKVV